MSIDRVARKSFGFIVAAMLGVGVYFQAQGAVELVAAKAFTVSQPESGRASRSRRSRTRPAASNSGKLDGDVILSRNPFDSVTGPLDRKAIQLKLPEPEKAAAPELDLSNPLLAPECEDVSLNIVSESPDPNWSVAQLKGKDDKEATMRRVGDAVGDLSVAYIGYNAYRASPAVWMVGESKLCQALLFAEKSAEANPAARTPTPPPRNDSNSRRRRTSSRGAPQVPDEIANSIQRVSETEFHVDRSVIDNVLENQATLMRSARIVPEQKDGKTVGIRLFGIRSDTLLGTLGMQNGDRLEKINGFDMGSPEKALEAYARLRTATSLTVQVTRRGKPLTIEYQIK